MNILVALVNSVDLKGDHRKLRRKTSEFNKGGIGGGVWIWSEHIIGMHKILNQLKNLNKSALETKSEISVIYIGNKACTEEHRKWKEFME